MLKTFFLLISLVVFSTPCFACPGANGIPDYNCDGKVVVSVIGDSLTYGIGDTANDNKGGYVLRTQSKFSDVEIINLGVAGLATRELLLTIRAAFVEGAEERFKDAVQRSDLVILDLGRNDRWLFGPPAETYRNLKRAATQIKQHVTKLEGFPPLVVTAVLMLPNRGSQGPWVKELNSIILRSDSKDKPADLRFDLVSKRLLGSDQIHPTPAGYSSLAKTLIAYLKTKIPKKMKILRPDTDGDGLPDIFETERFGTDPQNPDTDSDSHLDGDEILKDGTDPLNAEV